MKPQNNLSSANRSLLCDDAVQIRDLASVRQQKNRILRRFVWVERGKKVRNLSRMIQRERMALNVFKFRINLISALRITLKQEET
jgi:hypothetical protein